MLERAMYNLYEWVVAGVVSTAIFTTLYWIANFCM